MKKLRELLSRLLKKPGFRRVLGGLTLATSSLFALVVRAAEGGHGGGHAAPHVNWWEWSAHAPPVGWFIVDFVIFVVGLVYFTRRPIRAAFLARHERIKRALAEADEAHRGASEKYEEYRGKLANVDAEAQHHVERGRIDGEHERDQIIAQAKEYSERLRQDARAVAAQEVDKARQRLQAEVIDQVLEATEKLLKDRLTDSDRERLLDEAIHALEHADTATAGRRGHKAHGERSAEDAS